MLIKKIACFLYKVACVIILITFVVDMFTAESVSGISKIVIKTDSKINNLNQLKFINEGQIVVLETGRERFETYFTKIIQYEKTEKGVLRKEYLEATFTDLNFNDKRRTTDIDICFKNKAYIIDIKNVKNSTFTIKAILKKSKTPKLMNASDNSAVYEIVDFR